MIEIILQCSFGDDFECDIVILYIGNEAKRHIERLFHTIFPYPMAAKGRTRPILAWRNSAYRNRFEKLVAFQTFALFMPLDDLLEVMLDNFPSVYSTHDSKLGSLQVSKALKDTCTRSNSEVSPATKHPTSCSADTLISSNLGPDTPKLWRPMDQIYQYVVKTMP